MLPNRSKFNIPIEQSNFLRNFNTLLLEKLIMLQQGTYSQKEMNRIICQLTPIKNPTDIRMDIDPIPVECNLEPLFYFQIQDTVKRLTGNYMPMDKLVRLLLGYFVRCYSGENNGPDFKPFIRTKPGLARAGVRKFKKRFNRFFKNRLESIPVIIDKPGKAE